jgi:tRNA pseudouridine38-40 synthase
VSTTLNHPGAAAEEGVERRVALIIEYEGTHYTGFQLQANSPTIQGEMECALTRFTGERIRIRAASRTDSGAHAQGQVVDFLTRSHHPPERFTRALNFFLPNDIKVQASYEMVGEFHSRRDAASRTYRYHVLNRPSPSPIRKNTHFWVRESLDVQKMDAASKDLVGIHDFRPFGIGHPKDRSAVRQVYHWDVSRIDDTILIDCQANGFLRHQIRRANGLLVEIGKGRVPVGAIREALESGSTRRTEWRSLPARGLCLIKVTYPDFSSKVKAQNETD